MTTRELLRQALTALEYHRSQTRPIYQTDLVMTALREELFKPEPEPVAYMMVNGSSGHGRPLVYVPPTDWHITWKAIPLYTKGK